MIFGFMCYIIGYVGGFLAATLIFCMEELPCDD